MKKTFDILNVTRNNYIKLLEGCSLEVLNTIPASFRNNIYWNVGHTIATQQLLCYKLSDLPFIVDENLVAKFKKGTIPEGKISEDELEGLKSMLISTGERVKVDFEAGIFTEFSPYTTSYGVTLNSIEDALEFNNVHEAMHFGICRSILKAING